MKPYQALKWLENFMYFKMYGYNDFRTNNSVCLKVGSSFIYHPFVRYRVLPNPSTLIFFLTIHLFCLIQCPLYRRLLIPKLISGHNQRYHSKFSSESLNDSSREALYYLVCNPTNYRSRVNESSIITVYGSKPLDSNDSNKLLKG